MSNAKLRLTIYLTDKDKATVKKRASQVGRNMSDYLAELVMWDNRFELVEHAREGTLEVKEIDYITAER